MIETMRRLSERDVAGDRRRRGERAGGGRAARRRPRGLPRQARRRDRARRHAGRRHAGDRVPPAADPARRRAGDQVLRLGARGDDRLGRAAAPDAPHGGGRRAREGAVPARGADRAARPTPARSRSRAPARSPAASRSPRATSTPPSASSISATWSSASTSCWRSPSCCRSSRARAVPALDRRRQRSSASGARSAAARAVRPAVSSTCTRIWARTRPTARASISPTLLASMDAGDVTRTCAVPFQSPPGSGYAGGQRRRARGRGGGGGRVVPFCRSEPGERFRGELEAALDAGARGIKLHTSLPGLDFSHPAARPRLRARRRAARADALPHRPRRTAVRARPRRACSSATRARRSCSPTARSPTCTRSARCATRTSASTRRSGTSLDVRALLAEAAPEQVLYGSDAPYYTPAGTQAKLFPQLAAVGASDAQRRDVAARSAARLLAGEPCARLSEPLGGGPAAVPAAPARTRVPRHGGAAGVAAGARPHRPARARAPGPRRPSRTSAPRRRSS